MDPPLQHPPGRVVQRAVVLDRHRPGGHQLVDRDRGHSKGLPGLGVGGAEEIGPRENPYEGTLVVDHSHAGDAVDVQGGLGLQR